MLWTLCYGEYSGLSVWAQSNHMSPSKLGNFPDGGQWREVTGRRSERCEQCDSLFLVLDVGAISKDCREFSRTWEWPLDDGQQWNGSSIFQLQETKFCQQRMSTERDSLCSLHKETQPCWCFYFRPRKPVPNF